jgi:electron-transferring-flavoprotein dehydrogenase
MPRRLSAPGLVLAGDGAAMCNVSELKGIHYAMHAGMFAAEAIYEGLKRGSTEDLSSYDEMVRESEIAKDLYRTRNMRQPASKTGFFVGSAIGSMMILSGGRFPPGRWSTHDDATVDVFVGPERDYPKPDGKTTFDKLSSVFASGNATRDDAPNHIRVQEKVPLEVALMWQNMCPAQVYEVPEEELEAARRNGKLDGGHEVELQVTPSNCVQCGAITAKGGRLTPPEGGDGPNYQVT